MEQNKQRKEYVKPVLVSRGKVKEVTLAVSPSAQSGSFFSSAVDGTGF